MKPRTIFDKRNYINKTFGDWTVKEYLGKKYYKGRSQFSRIFLCECKCGNTGKILLNNLTCGLSTGCPKCRVNRIVGYKNNITRDPMHHIWYNMMNRCYNPNYKNFKNYGGRGIGVCKHWHNIENFVRDMSPRPEGLTIDRINNDRGYSKENCRWVDWKTQANNKKFSNCLTKSNLAKLTGYTAERIRQITHTHLQQFIKEQIDTGQNERIIFKQQAIEYLRNKRNQNNYPTSSVTPTN